MRVGQRRVDRHGVLESPDRFRELPALLVDQAKLILRLAIVRIDGGGLQIPAKALPAAQSRAQIAQVRRADRRKCRTGKTERQASPADIAAGPKENTPPPAESTINTQWRAQPRYRFRTPCARRRKSAPRNRDTPRRPPQRTTAAGTTRPASRGRFAAVHAAAAHVSSGA